ncbi:MAG: hypothetical protein LBM93_12175 [Oscillospiraceae bacterium]|nr:hypothetical protein [Oscillospiraceae bacterium]
MFGYKENELPAVLSPEEEKNLFLRYKNGDTSAREELIKHNLRMVMGILQNYRRYKLDEEDMASEGVKGLIIAIDKFDV